MVKIMQRRIAEILAAVLAIVPLASASQADCEHEAERIVDQVFVDLEGIHVTLDGLVWTEMPYTEKLELALTISCAIAGQGKQLPTALYFHDSATQHVVGKFIDQVLDLH